MNLQPLRSRPASIHLPSRPDIQRDNRDATTQHVAAERTHGQFQPWIAQCRADVGLAQKTVQDLRDKVTAMTADGVAQQASQRALAQELADIQGRLTAAGTGAPDPELIEHRDLCQQSLTAKNVALADQATERTRQDQLRQNLDPLLANVQASWTLHEPTLAAHDRLAEAVAARTREATLASGARLHMRQSVGDALENTRLAHEKADPLIRAAGHARQVATAAGVTSGGSYRTQAAAEQAYRASVVGWNEAQAAAAVTRQTRDDRLAEHRPLADAVVQARGRLDAADRARAPSEAEWTRLRAISDAMDSLKPTGQAALAATGQAYAVARPLIEAAQQAARDERAAVDEAARSQLKVDAAQQAHALAEAAETAAHRHMSNRDGDWQAAVGVHRTNVGVQTAAETAANLAEAAKRRPEREWQASKATSDRLEAGLAALTTNLVVAQNAQAAAETALQNHQPTAKAASDAIRHDLQVFQAAAAQLNPAAPVSAAGPARTGNFRRDVMSTTTVLAGVGPVDGKVALPSGPRLSPLSAPGPVRLDPSLPQTVAARQPARGARGDAERFRSDMAKLFGQEDGPQHLALASSLALTPTGEAGRRDAELHLGQARLVGIALRSVTDDPQMAAHVYDRLWNNPLPLNHLVAAPGARPVSPMHELTRLAPPLSNADQAVLAVLAAKMQRDLMATPGGREALMNLTGRVLPPDDVAHATDRHLAELEVEHYQVMCQARELAAREFGIADQGQTDDAFEVALRAQASSRAVDALHPDHLAASGAVAAQAFAYAKAGLAQANGGNVARVDNPLMPAYVALRSGPSAEGPDSHFHAMLDDFESALKYVRRPCNNPPPRPADGQWGRLGTAAVKKPGFKDTVWMSNKDPLGTMIQTGYLGADLATLKAEERANAVVMVDSAQGALAAATTHRWAAASVDGRVRLASRQAAAELWQAHLAQNTDLRGDAPMAVDRGALLERTLAIANAQTSTPPMRQLSPAQLRELPRGSLDSHTVEAWMRDADVSSTPAASDGAAKATRRAHVLQGRALLESDFERYQADFFNAPTREARAVALGKAWGALTLAEDVGAYTDSRKLGGTFSWGMTSGYAKIGPIQGGIDPVVLDVSLSRQAAQKASAGAVAQGTLFSMDRGRTVEGSVAASGKAGFKAAGIFGLVGTARYGGVGLARTTGHGLIVRNQKNNRDNGRLASRWKENGPQAVEALTAMAFDPAVTNGVTAFQTWCANARAHERPGLSVGRQTNASWKVTGLAPGLQVAASLGYASAGNGAAASATAGLLPEYSWQKAQIKEHSAGGGIEQTGTTHKFTGKWAAVAQVSGTGRQDGHIDHQPMPLLKVGAEGDLEFHSGAKVLRLMVENGKVNREYSVYQQHHSSYEGLEAAVNRHLDHWTQNLGVVGTDNVVRHGREAVIAALEDAQQLAPRGSGNDGLKSWITREMLTEQAAGRIGQYLDETAMLQRASDSGSISQQQAASELQRLTRAIGEIMDSPSDHVEGLRLYVGNTQKLSAQNTVGLSTRVTDWDNPVTADAYNSGDTYGGGLSATGTFTGEGSRDLAKTTSAMPKDRVADPFATGPSVRVRWMPPAP